MLKKYLGIILLLLVAFAQQSGAKTSGKSANECARLAKGLEGDAKQRHVISCLLGDDGKPLPPPTHYILQFSVKKPNSADGVGVTMQIGNPNQASAIKYMMVILRPYNAVGDPVVVKSRGIGVKPINYTGPLSSTDTPENAATDVLWYHPTITCAVIESVAVDYMDGTKKMFSGPDLGLAVSPVIRNSCSVSAK